MQAVVHIGLLNAVGVIECQDAIEEEGGKIKLVERIGAERHSIPVGIRAVIDGAAGLARDIDEASRAAASSHIVSCAAAGRQLA